MFLKIFVIFYMIFITKNYVIGNKNPFVPDVDLIKKSCGADATYCNDLATYPKDHVNKIRADNADYIKKLVKESDFVDFNLPRRFRKQAEEEDTEFCPSIEELATLDAAETEHHVWKFIFNDGKSGIHTVKCKQIGGNCGLSVPGYKLTCSQKYIFRTLPTLNSTGGVENESFRVPSGCVCSYKQM